MKIAAVIAVGALAVAGAVFGIVATHHSASQPLDLARASNTLAKSLNERPPSRPKAPKPVTTWFILGSVGGAQYWVGDTDYSSQASCENAIGSGGEPVQVAEDGAASVKAGETWVCVLGAGR